MKSQPGITEVGWNTSDSKVTGKFWTAGTGSSGIMIGSSWQRGCNATARVSRVVQHAVNSFEHFEEVRAAGRTVYLEFATYSASSFTGVDRNGYLSQTVSYGLTGLRVLDIWYWIEGLGPMRGTPRSAVEAIPFTW